MTLCDENAGERVDYDTSAQIVGITGYNLQNARVYAHAERFRARGKTVVLGGPLANILSDECRPHCDVLFQGEAEYTWPQFLRDYFGGRWADHYEQQDKINLPVKNVGSRCGPIDWEFLASFLQLARHNWQ